MVSHAWPMRNGSERSIIDESTLTSSIMVSHAWPMNMVVSGQEVSEADRKPVGEQNDLKEKILIIGKNNEIILKAQ